MKNNQQFLLCQKSSPNMLIMCIHVFLQKCYHDILWHFELILFSLMLFVYFSPQSTQSDRNKFSRVIILLKESDHLIFINFLWNKKVSRIKPRPRMPSNFITSSPISISIHHDSPNYNSLHFLSAPQCQFLNKILFLKSLLNYPSVVVCCPRFAFRLLHLVQLPQTFQIVMSYLTSSKTSDKRLSFWHFLAIRTYNALRITYHKDK